MVEQVRHRRSRQRPLTANELVDWYHQAIAEAVEATLAEALADSQASVTARERAAVAWRDPLTIVAAEELSRRLASRAVRAGSPDVAASGLRRALRAYAPLVTAAACAEQAADRAAFVAAD